MKHPVSGYMLVYNEVRSIEASVRCLLHYCDDVLILDGGSTDGSLEKLLMLHREFEHLRIMLWKQQCHRYDMSWQETTRRKWATTACLHDWILTIDADELLDDLPKDYFQLQESPLIFDMFHLVNKTEIITRYNSNGNWQTWYPDSHVRYFNRTLARYANTRDHSYVESNDGQSLMQQSQHSGTGLFHYHALVNSDRKWDNSECRKLLETMPLPKPLPALDRLILVQSQ